MSEREHHKKDKEVVVEFHSPKQAAQEAADPVADPLVQKPGDPAGASSAGEIARLQAEKEELTQTLMRRQADFENYRKRVERERQEEGRRGVGRMAEELLPMLDGFERALHAHDDPAYEEYRKGLELIYRQLLDTLSRNGVERISAAGKIFDPNFHQAIERVDTHEVPDGTVVGVLQDGFLFHGRVLRPSIVRVAVNPQGTGGSESSAVRHQVD
jgi:molecular chaperone GrpE